MTNEIKVVDNRDTRQVAVRKVKAVRLDAKPSTADVIIDAETSKPIRTAKVSRVPVLVDSLFNILNGLTHLKQLINDNEKIDCEDVLNVVSQGTLNTFVTYFLDTRIDKLKRNGTYDIVNLIASTLLFVHDYLYTLKGKSVVDPNEIDVMRELLTMRTADVEKFYRDDFNFVMKDFTVMNMGEHIPSKKKRYKGSQVFINLGNGMFKAIPYKYYKKLDSMSQVIMSYSIREYDQSHREGEDEYIIHYEKEVIATSVTDVFREIFEYCSKFNFVNMELIHTGAALEVELEDVVVNFKSKSKGSESFDSIYEFLFKYVPGGFYI